ncbi:hypothetical protein L484_014650 [Morus notabilis]|uniref:LOB domain-containing protein n=1 Tax=Morus notabilis TaxID=981085 RepID=W9RM27_9ROSA|nr:LOB domain-containing protein 42 [Morus notabilis]EXB97039.1 hypothetical protein L484_014650 [Morus notabilis]
MRTSCNGCRVLRKGCSDNCTIKPCLQWIKSPDSQAHATLFLAKFYGRTGLLNLIDAGPEYLRPAVFKSLLYEACGRIVNPIYGSVGLLWSGEWEKCQVAVEAVLAGMPITGDGGGDGGALNPKLPLKSCDIRHVAKDSSAESADQKLNQVVKTRNRFKRTSAKHRNLVVGSEFGVGGSNGVADFTRFLNAGHEYYWWTCPAQGVNGTSCEDRESMFSVETVEASLARRAEPSRADDREVGLELTLGLA